MTFLAWLSLGFLGIASTGFDGNGQSPLGGGVDAPNYSNFNALVPLQQVDSRVSSVPFIFIPIHTPSHFPFVTVVKDDGEGPAGGWQEARANLPFGRILPYGVNMWYCTITIGMPIRHSVQGYIAPATAATKSAAVTNKAASQTDYDLPHGIFCSTFRKNVETLFPTMFPVGAKVNR